MENAQRERTGDTWDTTASRGQGVNGSDPLLLPGVATPGWAVAWSPSGRCLIGATSNTTDEQQRESVQVWSTTSWQLLIIYAVPSSTGYADGTLSVAWSPDSMRLALGGADTIVHL